MPNRLSLCFLALTCISPLSGALAQPADPGKLSVVELRSGVTTGFGTAAGPPSFGLAFRFRPWPVLDRRLSIYTAGDFRHHSRHEAWDDEFKVPARTGRSVFLLGGAMGVDVVRTARATLDVRGGVSFLRDYATFDVRSGAGFVNDPSREWEPVCAFAPYRGRTDRCGATYSATGTVAVGFRFSPARNGSLFFGVDYTRLLRGQNVIAAVIGAQSR